MELGRVIGTCVCSVKTPGLDGIKLLFLQPLDHLGKSVGEPLIACDTVKAGPDDLVYWVKGREATLALPETFVPVDAAITGIVDQVSSGGKVLDLSSPR